MGEALFGRMDILRWMWNNGTLHRITDPAQDPDPDPASALFVNSFQDANK